MRSDEFALILDKEAIFLFLHSTQTNTEMTDLLKQKAEDGELDDCGNEQLEVIDKIK